MAYATVALTTNYDDRIIDGEIVALDQSGKPSFDALRHSHRKGAIVFYAFDLLHFDGEDVSQYPLVAWKETFLSKPPRAPIRYTEYIEDQGERLFART